MNQENALGAPTEGLGQTVTFALKGMPAPQALQVAGPGRMDAMPAGGQGGQLTLGAAPVQQPTDPTFALIMKAADSVLNKQIENGRKEAFLSGMQKARAGQALADIAAEQPWYSRIFGESDVVTGARVFTQQTKAQETVNSLREMMPELRTKGMDEVRQVISDTIDKAMTGDTETDMFLMQSFSRTMPDLMAAHAREHYKYTQERAVDAHGKMLASGARSLQQVAAEHVANDTPPEEFEAARGQYVSMLVQPAGMTDESYHKALSQHIIAASEAGDFHAISAIREAGAIDVLPEQERARVLRAIDINERNLPAGPAGDAFAERLYNLRKMAHEISVNDGPMPTPEVLRSQYDKLNQDWMRHTGSTRPLVSKATVTNESLQMHDEIEQALAKDHRERMALARERAREAKLDRLLAGKTGADEAASARTSAMDTAWQMENPAMLFLGEDAPKETEVNALVSRRMAPYVFRPGPLDDRGKAEYRRYASFLAVGKGEQVLSMVLAPRYQAAKRAGGPASPEFALVYENFLRLKEADPSVLPKVFPPEALKDLNKFHAQHPQSLHGAEVTPNAVAAFSYAIDPNTRIPNVDIPKEDRKAIVKQLVKEHSFMVPELLGGQPDLPERQANIVMADMAATYKELLETTGSPEDALKQSFGVYTQRGGRIVGGYAWRDRSVKGKQTWEVFTQGNKDVLIPNDPKIIGRGFKEFIGKKVAELGDADAENAVIVPAGDGKHFQIITTTRDGSSIATPRIPYGEVGKFLHVTKPRDTTFGTNTYTPEKYKAGVEIVQEELRNRQGK